MSTTSKQNRWHSHHRTAYQNDTCKSRHVNTTSTHIAAPLTSHWGLPHCEKSNNYFTQDTAQVHTHHNTCSGWPTHHQVRAESTVGHTTVHMCRDRPGATVCSSYHTAVWCVPTTNTELPLIPTRTLIGGYGPAYVGGCSNVRGSSREGGVSKYQKLCRLTAT